MPDSTLILLMSFSVIVLLVGALVFLTVLLFRSQKAATGTILTLLRDQVVESQSLRNQLRAQSVPELLGMQHATLPSEVTASNEQGSDPVDISTLAEAISYEEDLAKAGYSIGDLGDLESSGWASPILKRNGDGDPIAFDPTL